MLIHFGGWNGIQKVPVALRKGCLLFMIFYWFGRFLQPPKITLEYRFWVPQYRHRSCPKDGNWKEGKKTNTDWSRNSSRELQGITGLLSCSETWPKFKMIKDANYVSYTALLSYLQQSMSCRNKLRKENFPKVCLNVLKQFLKGVIKRKTCLPQNKKYDLTSVWKLLMLCFSFSGIRLIG